MFDGFRQIACVSGDSIEIGCDRAATELYEELYKL